LLILSLNLGMHNKMKLIFHLDREM